MGNDRAFQIGETVRLRSKPEIEQVVLAIHQVNNVPVAVTLAGFGDRFFEELQHLDEPIEEQ